MNNARIAGRLLVLTCLMHPTRLLMLLSRGMFSLPSLPPRNAAEEERYEKWPSVRHRSGCRPSTVIVTWLIKLQISRSVCKNSNFLPTLYTAESVKRLVMVNFRWDHHHIVDYKPDMKFVRPPAEKYQDNYFNIMHCGELIIKCLEVTQVKVGFH